MKGKTVLIVEPDVNIMSVLVFFVAENGATARQLNDKSKAIDVITNEHFDAVILDLSFLYVAEDIEILRKIVATASGVPVVVISTRRSMDLVSRIMSVGAKGFFHQPLSMKALMGRIDQLFESATSPAA